MFFCIEGAWHLKASLRVQPQSHQWLAMAALRQQTPALQSVVSLWKVLTRSTIRIKLHLLGDIRARGIRDVPITQTELQ